MSAYLICHITVLDPDRWQAYRAAVPATLAPWGGELMFRGRLTTVLAGRHDGQDTVVIRFPDPGALAAWHASPAYQALVPLRESAARVTLLAFDPA